MLNINNGFPHTDSYQATQDKKGFIWFATLNGLCRFDGNNIVTYTNNYHVVSSVINSRILNIYYDKGLNGLWLGTQGGGLLFFDIETEQFKAIGKNQIGDFIAGLFIDSQHKLWVASDKGLFIHSLIKNEELTSMKFVKIANASFNGAVAIYEDHNRVVYFGNKDGVYTLRLTTGGKGYNYQKFLPQVITSAKVLSEFEFDGTNYLLIGNNSGLYKFSYQTGECICIKKYAVSCLFVDNSSKTVLVGTTNNGTDDLKMETIAAAKSTLIGEQKRKQPEVKYIFKDSFGTLYTSILGQGVVYNNAFDRKFTAFPTATSNWKSPIKQVISFTSNDSRYIWIGSRGEGLVLMDRATNNYSFLQNTDQSSFSDKNYVSALHVDKTSSLLLGTYEGLYILKNVDPEKIKRGMHPPVEKIDLGEGNVRINKILEDKNGVTWVATSNGICLLKDHKLLKNLISFKDKQRNVVLKFINYIYLNGIGHDGSYDVWVGTMKEGLYRLKIDAAYNIQGSQIFNVENKSLLSNWVTSMVENKHQKLFVGTLGGGLSVINLKTNAINQFNKANGLVTDDVESLLDDNQGNIWIGSKGLIKFNYEQKKFWYYDVTDGLQSNSFKVWSAYKMATGELIFGGINGYNIFDPAKIINNNSAAKVALTGLNISNKAVEIGAELDGEVILKKSISYTKEINLNHNIKSFSLDFNSIHTQNSDKKSYRYKLIGFDKDWVYTSAKKNFAAYSNLKPDTYEFVYQGSNGEGVWSKGDNSLFITIEPSFWQSGYGYFLYFLVLAAVIYFSTKFAFVKVKTKNEILFQTYKQEQELKNYQDKLQFFTNVSHELRTPLSLIITPIEQIFDNSNLNKELFDKLDVVYKNSKRLKKLIDQLLNLRKYELGKVEITTAPIDIYLFLKQICAQFEDLAQEKFLDFTLTGKPGLFAEIDKDKLDQVFLNLLSNAIKFTPNHSKIEVNVFQHENKIVIEVKNLDSHIDEETRLKIFEPFYRSEKENVADGFGLGLSISKYLVELHKGSIQIVSEAGNAHSKAFSSFIVELPALVDYETAPSHHALEAKKNRTILIVEDNDDMRRLLHDFLSNEYDVIACQNGLEALEIAKKQIPDLILTDLMMPELDGISLIKRIKKAKFLAHIPIIILSAKSSEESKIEGLQALANDFIEKPFNLRILNLKIRNLIQSSDKLIMQGHLEEKLEPTEIKVLGYNEKVYSDVMFDIEKNIENHEYSVSDLCANINLSRSKLFRIIKSEVGMSINGLIIDVRLKRAAQLLKQRRYSVSEIMYMVGFENASYFNRSFKAKYGDTPKKYSKENESTENSDNV
ncbi:hybrid sensor histidine kinase/response regulator [Pedobacter sp. MW01-1-1]|uniref:hybrid sensor histidine kinase/response regulator n=1 Tax=Pedobacter sp. MW01-1-1 TaxID=3383027 RepID=UPI003FEF7F35